MKIHYLNTYNHTPSIFFVPPDHITKHAYLKIDFHAKRPAGRESSLLYIKHDNINKVIPESERTGALLYDISGKGHIPFDENDGKGSIVIDLSDFVVATLDNGVKGSVRMNWL